jgi:metal-responsive CopG/Arc/MetJ family transcriptional regulator
MARPKGQTKQKVGFSIDIKTAKQLDDFCDLKSINRSKLVNKIVKDYLENTIVTEWEDK